jgi:hypothetical protein
MAEDAWDIIIKDDVLKETGTWAIGMEMERR